MKRVDRHPTDEQLIARYFDPCATEEAIRLHVVGCRDCASRDALLTAALDDDHDRVAQEADAAFPASRLVAQREAILDRIARPRTARILAFPSTAVAGFAALPSSRRPARWVAAAAMLVTLAGAYGNWWIAFQRPGDAQLAGNRTAVLAPAGHTATLELDHDAVLSAIDRALERPGARELRALDALTPYANDPAR